MNHFPRRPLLLSRSFLFACLIACLSLQPAMADVADDARSFASSGKLAEALAATDKYLANSPNDAQMLFLKGVILTQQGEKQNAINVFTRLTEKYPALPEPYNNLAVLHAAEGQYDKARTILEKGMRTNPSYATTYDNLGAVYAKLASQAYDKALQTSTSTAPDKTRLALVHSLVTGPQGEKIQPIVVAAAPAPVISTPSVPDTSVVKTEPKIEPKTQPEASTTGDRDEITQTLNDWAAAWSSKDVKKYLSFYGNDFKTPGGKSRKAWEEERRARIVGKGRINVKVESPQITVAGNTATVKFKQAYSSDRLSATSKKTVIFTKSDGKWKILQELSN
jgi:tetratricopeptide (TPR) repeat protein